MIMPVMPMKMVNNTKNNLNLKINGKIFGSYFTEEHADDDNEASGTDNDPDIDEVIQFPFFT